MRFPDQINVSDLVSITKATFATTLSIDDPANLAAARVWVLSALQDSVVATGVVEATVGRSALEPF